MAIKAYVLIEAHVGKTREIVDAIHRLKVVVSVDVVTGPYDAIAVIQAETLNEIEDLVVSMVQTVTGVSRTVTCVAL